jgi:hypothetical protein
VHRHGGLRNRGGSGGRGPPTRLIFEHVGRGPPRRIEESSRKRPGGRPFRGQKPTAGSISGSKRPICGKFQSPGLEFGGRKIDSGQCSSFRAFSPAADPIGSRLPEQPLDSPQREMPSPPRRRSRRACRRNDPPWN